MTSEELATQRDRTKLILAVPVLRGASFGNLIETMRLVTEVVAERVGRPADNIAVRTFAGAAFGVMMEIMLRWADDPDMDPIAALDEAMALLEAGLPF
jgi:hypothetical protein